jgi:hypothetical protein
MSSIGLAWTHAGGFEDSRAHYTLSWTPLKRIQIQGLPFFSCLSLGCVHPDLQFRLLVLLMAGLHVGKPPIAMTTDIVKRRMLAAQ